MWILLWWRQKLLNSRHTPHVLITHIKLIRCILNKGALRYFKFFPHLFIGSPLFLFINLFSINDCDCRRGIEERAYTLLSVSHDFPSVFAFPSRLLGVKIKILFGVRCKPLYRARHHTTLNAEIRCFIIICLTIHGDWELLWVREVW